MGNHIERDDDRRVRRWLARHRVEVRGLSLADHIGSPRAKREVESLAATLRAPDEVTAAGGSLVRAALFTGPPGAGKTNLARILASLVGNVPYYECQANELTGGLVARLARHFARHPEPAVIYLDELDAVALERGSRLHDRHSRAVLYSMLAALDGLRGSGSVCWVASTNAPPALLDPALLREGRFGSRIIRLDLPTLEERAQLFAYFLSQRRVVEPIDVRRAAELTRGRSGADIRAALDEGLALSVSDGLPALSQRHLEEAIRAHGERDEVPPLSLAQRRRQAVHESAHLIVALETMGPGAITAVSIGDHRGGRTELGPDDRSPTDLSDPELLDRVAVLVAGQIGEQLATGSTSQGGASDAAQATRLLLARLESGGDSTWGSLAVDPYGMEAGPALLDARATYVRVELDRQSARARAILERRMDALTAFAEQLMHEHTLSGDALSDAITQLPPAEVGAA